jgi:uncharacterized protein YbdZ (MbtH family)
VAKRHKANPSLQFTAPQSQSTQLVRCIPESYTRMFAETPHRLSSPPLWFGTVHIPCLGRLGGLLSINSFGDDTGSFLALDNDEKQHSLRAAYADVPAGWLLVHGEADRASCLDFGLHRTKRERYTAVKSAQEAWQRAGRRISTM